MEIMNKKGAGQYNRPMSHLLRSTSIDNLAGHNFTWTPDGNTYWASVQQIGSVDVEVDNRLQTKTSAKVCLRGWLTISTTDRLIDLNFGETYILTSVYRGADETICEGYIW